MTTNNFFHEFNYIILYFITDSLKDFNGNCCFGTNFRFILRGMY